MTTTTAIDEITDSRFAGEVLGADLPVLVQFTADWCPSCRQLAPVLSAIADQERDRIRVVRLNVDHNPETPVAYQVMAVPTLMVFRDGEPVASMVGTRTKRRLLQEIEDAL